MKNRESYIAKMKLQLDELDTQMTTLEDKAKEAKASAHDKYMDEMKKLRHESTLAQQKFNELIDSSEGKWDLMVGEMEKVRDAFKHSFSYFKSQL